MTPSELLKNARKRAKLTQPELYKISGVSVTTISRIETGEVQNPSWNVMCALLKACGVQEIKF